MQVFLALFLVILSNLYHSSIIFMLKTFYVIVREALMKQILWVIHALLSILLFIPIAVWILLDSSSVNALIKDFEKDLRSLTHLPIQFKGKIHIHLWPLPYLHIPHITIQQNLEHQVLNWSIDDLRFKIKLYPLFHKKIIFHQIESQHLSINSNTNFPLVQRISDRQTSKSFTSLKTLNPQNFDVEKLIIHDGKFSTSHSGYLSEVSSIELVARQIKLNQPFEIQISSFIHYQLPQSPPSKTKLSYQGTVNLGQHEIRTFAELLEHARLDGVLQLQEIAYHDFMIQEIKTHLMSQDHNLVLNPLNIKLLEGLSTGDARFELNKNQIFFNQLGHQIHINIPTSSDGFDMGRIFNLSGHLNYDLHGQINLNGQDLFNSITGHGHLMIIDGNLHHFDLKKIIRLAQVKIHRLLTPGDQDQSPETPIFNNPEIYWGNTHFNELSMNISLEQGDVRSHEFKFENEDIKIQGQGVYNISSRQLNSKINVSFDTGDQQLNQIEAMLSQGFTLSIFGETGHLHIRPDLSIIMPYLKNLIINRSLNSPLEQIQNEFSNFFNPNPS